MNNPLFSILIAQYNNGKYLSEAIESIKSQTYTNWEIIIVDDCSTDNSKELYKQYENDEKIKIYYNDENKGCGYTKRRCTELASGELCGFLDPDDTLTDDALEVMTQEHRKNPQAAVICSRHFICDDNMKPLWESAIRKKQSLSYLTERSHSPEVFASFKKKMYDKSVGLNPAFKRAVDQDLYYLLEEQGKMIFIDNVLYYYRIHSNSISNGDNKALYWHILAIKDACERRKINTEDVANKVLTDLFDIQKQQIQKLQNSSYYRLGYRILFPIQKMKNKCRKIFRKIF